jgi:hypothetical protein
MKYRQNCVKEPPYQKDLIQMPIQVYRYSTVVHLFKPEKVQQFF